jgi:hypothetical protein
MWRVAYRRRPQDKTYSRRLFVIFPAPVNRANRLGAIFPYLSGVPFASR